ncbi:uncharacterized protein CDAR_573001 [Caerostris darwini]|uniref:Neuropeptide Y n=1 Tax=Caerostris darwini TaxID=1538125 RepID=A0AAV4W5L3_9ARAC|nr:uncharacterized protein CDAR_573001 [Caerostris darwini]
MITTLVKWTKKDIEELLKFLTEESSPFNMSTMLGLLVTCTLLLAVSIQASMNNGEQGEIIAELPTQPMVFNTPDELRTYLQELDKYFAIVGRPRFGRTLGNGYSRNIYPYFRANPLPPPSF